MPAANYQVSYHLVILHRATTDVKEKEGIKRKDDVTYSLELLPLLAVLLVLIRRLPLLLVPCTLLLLRFETHEARIAMAQLLCLEILEQVYQVVRLFCGQHVNLHDTAVVRNGIRIRDIEPCALDCWYLLFSGTCIGRLGNGLT
jgi:hypothetical protein